MVAAAIAFLEQAREIGLEPELAAIICGFLGCDARPYNPLLATLPRRLLVRHEQLAGRSLSPLSSHAAFRLER